MVVVVVLGPVGVGESGVWVTFVRNKAVLFWKGVRG